MNENVIIYYYYIFSVPLVNHHNLCNLNCTGKYKFPGSMYFFLGAHKKRGPHFVTRHLFDTHIIKDPL